MQMEVLRACDNVTCILTTILIYGLGVYRAYEDLNVAFAAFKHWGTSKVYKTTRGRPNLRTKWHKKRHCGRLVARRLASPPSHHQYPSLVKVLFRVVEQSLASMTESRSGCRCGTLRWSPVPPTWTRYLQCLDTQVGADLV
jgi:hypothetical protein